MTFLPFAAAPLEVSETDFMDLTDASGSKHRKLNNLMFLINHYIHLHTVLIPSEKHKNYISIKTALYQTLSEHLPKISKENLAHRAILICNIVKSLHVCHLVKHITLKHKTIVPSGNESNKLFLFVFRCVRIQQLSSSNAL